MEVAGADGDEERAGGGPSGQESPAAHAEENPGLASGARFELAELTPRSKQIHHLQEVIVRQGEQQEERSKQVQEELLLLRKGIASQAVATGALGELQRVQYHLTLQGIQQGGGPPAASSSAPLHAEGACIWHL